jgi:4-hydroxy-tetrahydrodipicolinate reductase
MTAPATKRYRVVQWATGNVGSRALRRVIEHRDLDLVGVWVHGAGKVGKDAGELAGIAPIGVKATNSIDEVLALKPDCVLYMPHVCDFDEICRILESGANIVTTRMELQNPVAMDPAVAARVEAACQKGGDRARLDPAAAGPSPDRRIRRLLVARFARDALRDDGLRRAARRGERGPVAAQADELRAVDATCRHGAGHAD